jgi:hypothetical protein
MVQVLFIFLMLFLATFIKHLFWKLRLFLLKLSLDIPFHLGSTVSATVEQGINAAIVSKQ